MPRPPTHPLHAEPGHTLAELYCARHGCTLAEFQARLFWRNLYPIAYPWARLLGGRFARHFAPDRDLLGDVGHARTMHEVRESIRDHFMDPANRQWLRRFGHVRVSTRKLKEFAREYLGRD